jgi:hypothetical protein
MQTDFKYRLDRRARRLTWIISLVLVVAALFFVLYSRSGYFPIWFTVFLITVLTLYLLSIPRKIRVTADTLNIQCVVELTSVALEDIALIRTMDKSEMKYAVPLLASYGFFGYYGWYYNISEFSLFKVYASGWGNFVRIEDIYETVYVVSCDSPDELIATVLEVKRLKISS